MRATYVGFATGLMLIPAQGAFAYTCETVTSSTTVQPKDLTIQRDLPVGCLLYTSDAADECCGV